MAQAKMVYEKHEDLRFEWSGGEYIEIFFGDSKTAFDVLNTWDYAKGEPRIERTLTAFTEFVENYIREVQEELIAQDPIEF